MAFSENTKCVMIWLFIIGLITAIISSIFAFPVYYAGYKEREERNVRLIKTTCQIIGNSIDEKICYRSCNCFTVCSKKRDLTDDSEWDQTDDSTGWDVVDEDFIDNEKRDSLYDGSSSSNTRQKTCTTHCSRCAYQCYSWQRTAMYQTKDKQNITYVEADGTEDFHSNAIDEVNNKPIGTKWTCYYDPEKMSRVMDAKYDVKSWRDWAISSFVFVGIGLIMILLAGVIWIGDVLSDCSLPDFSLPNFTIPNFESSSNTNNQSTQKSNNRASLSTSSGNSKLSNSPRGLYRSRANDDVDPLPSRVRRTSQRSVPKYPPLGKSLGKSLGQSTGELSPRRHHYSIVVPSVDPSAPPSESYPLDQSLVEPIPFRPQTDWEATYPSTTDLEKGLKTKPPPAYV